MIWVVGAQKIVKDMEEGLRRIREHVLGLETMRARKACGLPENEALGFQRGDGRRGGLYSRART